MTSDADLWPPYTCMHGHTRTRAMCACTHTYTVYLERSFRFVFSVFVFFFFFPLQVFFSSKVLWLGIPLHSVA